MHGKVNFFYTHNLSDSLISPRLCSDPDIAKKIGIPSDYSDYHCDETQAGCCYNFISKVIADAAQWAPHVSQPTTASAS